MAGVNNAFGKFFALDNFEVIFEKLTDWMFDSLKPKFAGFTLPKPMTWAKLPEVATDVLLRVTGINEINAEFFKELAEDVTGIRVDKVMEGESAIKDLVNGGSIREIANTLWTKLEGFTDEILSSLLDTGEEILVDQLFKLGVEALGNLVTPGVGTVLKKLYSGFQWLLDGKNQAGLEKMIDGFFTVVDSVIDGPPDTVGSMLVEAANNSVVPLVSLTMQLLTDIDIPGTIAKIFQAMEMTNLLLKHGAALDLNSAVYIKGCPYVVNQLKTNPELLKNTGPPGNLLSDALRCKSVELVELLLSLGVSVHDAGARKVPPLFFAVDEDSVEIVRLLLKNGADIRTKDSDGRTILKNAEFMRASEEVVDLLVKAGAKK